MSVLLLLFSCLTPKAVPAIPVVSAPILHERTIGYGALFSGRNSNSIYDTKLLSPDLMKRVLVEAEIIEVNLETIAIENWTRRLLFQTLIAQGSTIVAPPVEQENPPTVVLRNLSFISSTEEIEVVVREKSDGDLQVLIRNSPAEESLCSEEMSLPIGFVEFAAAVQRFSDGAIIAMIHEIRLLPSLDEPTRISVAIDDSTPERLCESIANIYFEEPALGRSAERYQEAAIEVLRTNVEPLYIIQSK